MPRDFTPATDCTSQTRPFIALEPVTSNQVKAIGYDPTTKTLAVVFTRGLGNVYHYPDVEADTYNAFRGAESIGTYFGKHIAKLPSMKFSPDPAPKADTAEGQDEQQAA